MLQNSFTDREWSLAAGFYVSGVLMGILIGLGLASWWF